MPWVKGQSGNPIGRQVGIRTRITEALLRDLEVGWREDGPAAIKKMATEHPSDFVKVMASLLPRDINITSDAFVDALKELNALRGPTLDAIVVQVSDEPLGIRDGTAEGPTGPLAD